MRFARYPLVSLWAFAFVGCMSVASPPSADNRLSVNIGMKRLSFAVPQPWRNQMGVLWRTGMIAPKIKESMEAGDYSNLFDCSWEMEGPFWVGGYGMFEFNGTVDPVPRLITATSLTPVEKVLQALKLNLSDFIRKGDRFYFEPVTINGIEWVRWYEHPFADENVRSLKPDAIFYENFSCLLNADTYLTIHMGVRMYHKDAVAKRDRWLPKAISLKQSIVNSLRIE
jgi:hypothetical protein